MSHQCATAESTVRLQPARDGRLIPYALIAVGGLAAALIGGHAALAALAVPFAIALGLGLRRTGPVPVTARIRLEAGQVVEGDVVEGRIALGWDGAFHAQVLLHRLQGVTAEGDAALAWSFPAGTGAVEIPFRVRATRWGRHTAAEVWVRLEAPFGLLSWTGKVVTGPTLRVLPGSERLNRLLDPAESRAILGMHRTRRIGDGGEFAQLRPYQPGDRLRDLNWAATARHGRPFVNRYHPELSGEVVIAIDAFSDGSTGSTDALRRAARAAWALASVHLKANDRVGLAGLGGRTEWLPPAGGRLARYRLLEALLTIGADVVQPAAVGRARAGTVPPSALVIAITPLHDDLTVATLKGWRARGRSVAVVTVDTTEFLPPPATAAEAMAFRLWRLEIGSRKRALERLGIPIIPAPTDGPIAPVVSALRRARTAPPVRRGR